MSRPRGKRFLCLNLVLPPDREDAAVAALHEAGCLGVQARPAAGAGAGARLLLSAWFTDRRTIRPLSTRLLRGLRATGVPVRRAPRLVVRRDHGWVEVWRRSLRPMRIGRRILIIPEGCTTATRGRVAIRMRFGRAFGTGEHASTRLALRLLELSLRAGDRVIDIGTGTGILAMAASRLGARTVRALDNDPVALGVARRNLLDNRLGRRVRLRRAEAGGGFRAGRFDLALVNIGAPTIAKLLPALAAGLRPGGRIVLSGIHVNDETALLRRAARLGLHCRLRLRRRPWSALQLQRAGRRPAA